MAEHRGRRDTARRTVVLALTAVAAMVAAVLMRRIPAGRAATGSDVLALGAAMLALVAWLGRARSDPDRWFRGAAGEQATAQMLDRLGRRWVVRHDLAIPGSRANLDHVVIGPSGVWVIDTKTYRAPMRAGWRSVRVGNHRLDTAAASWEAQVVGDRLRIATTPVVAVHGRGLPPRGRIVGGVRVIPADQLVGYLRRGWVHRWLVGLTGRAAGGGQLERSLVDRLATELDGVFVPAVGGEGA